MGLYTNFIFPRLIDWVLRAERIREERQRLLADIHGEVLEIGFGTGLNLPHYPRTMTSLHATDPARFLPKRVADRIAQVAFLFMYDRPVRKRCPTKTIASTMWSARSRSARSLIRSRRCENVAGC